MKKNLKGVMKKRCKKDSLLYLGTHNIHCNMRKNLCDCDLMAYPIGVSLQCRQFCSDAYYIHQTAENLYHLVLENKL